MQYLLVTHISFARLEDGTSVLDGLWAEDLKGLVAAIGPITVAAPQLTAQQLQSWGPGVISLTPEDRIAFVGLPIRKGRFDFTYAARVRKALRGAVAKADLVHSSNLFQSDLALYYAHDLAVKLNKKTLFVVAEDFYDMQLWEWIRPERHWLKRWRAQLLLDKLDRHVRRRVQTSSLTFLHTPAAVARYRLFAANGVAIRQPVHEREDVISAERFAARRAAQLNLEPLTVCTAGRLEPLKGVDFLLRAVSILKQRDIFVRARLYGRGKQLDALKALAGRLGIADRVEFPGALSPTSVLREALAGADLFLMPHLSSDFGRAFFDGLSAGCPVIAFRSIASEDTVRHGVDGLIAPNADDEGLADAIAQYHRDRDMLVRASEAARARALENTKSFWSGYRARMILDLFPASRP
jgi:glycosyltransferase involved in cell wall biosynthesis